MKLEVLMSCMHQEDYSLVYKSGITTDVMIVNQANRKEMIERQKEDRRIRMITTTERGLSRSRNMTMRHSKGDICLFCDDDEEFVSDYEALVLQAFENAPYADIIAFDVKNKETRLKKKFQRLGYLRCMKISSVQIAFRRRSVLGQDIRFDLFMGSGTGNGSGEEIKFLWDCLKEGLRVYYAPITIATLKQRTSVWFAGYDDLFFYQRGGSTRYMMGFWLSSIYGIYYLIFKHSLYKQDMTMRQAAKALFRGIKENPIERQKEKSKGDMR